MTLTNRVVVIALAFVLLSTCRVYGIAPAYVSDEELAAYPIIVVAQWDKTPAKRHDKYQDDKALGQVIVKCEVYTSLNVLEVVKGQIEPGVHDLMIGWGISWRPDGTWLSSGTSTEISGDVGDVTKPCLWFLKRERSWDESREAACISVSNYREIQPLELRRYFVELGGKNSSTEVPLLLTSGNASVARRVLHYLCGGNWPWPNEVDERFGRYTTPTRRGHVLNSEADRVWKLVTSDAKELRPTAVSVYAELKGEGCVPSMRTLLDDDDPEVRGIAVGILARYRDEASLERFPKAVEGVEDGSLACKLIKVLSSWDDERVVRPIISFLQNDRFAYQYGDDIGIPALKARQALKEITGHTFPFNVEESLNGWREAEQIEERTARREFLSKTVPADQSPFIAQAMGEPRTVADETLDELEHFARGHEVSISIRLLNNSTRPKTILKEPSAIALYWPAGSSSSGGGLFAEPGDLSFVTIEPGASTELEVKLHEGFLIAEPAKRKLELRYSNIGNRSGVNSWIGTVVVEFGSEWKGKRETKQVEEAWPNGNLKATGMTVNGHKFGEWNYFNENGDRIRVEQHENGRGSGPCNPEHPKNKGAGIRPKK